MAKLDYSGTSGKQPSAIGGPPSHSILDGIITGIFGPSTDEMTPEEGAKVDRQRDAAADKAYGMAKSARTNPGAEWMNGPESVGGSGDIMKFLGSIASIFG